MKELIGSVIFIVSLLGTGSYALREVHHQVQKMALQKSSQGMPSLLKMTKSLRGEDVK